MSIFQNSVLKSFVQDESKIAIRWTKFQEYINKIGYIKTVKEEKYQDGFLKDIFVSCLGYTLDSENPQNYNLAREEKNEQNSKKADAVIKCDGKVVGVIELKDQNTKNLNNIEDQAFNYHNSHTNSKYIITSNFDELRFYCDKRTAFEKFNLFTLSYEEFKKLHLLLCFENIKDDMPLKLKEKSTNFETTISKELYKDFSNFRAKLFENIVQNNQLLEKSQALRLTQKLCDRIIFVLFAEDKALIRPNTIEEIIKEFENQKFTSYSLYEIFKIYFEAINSGNEKLEIAKYNGGLFLEDKLLDSLKIDDDILQTHTKILSKYDFDSEISVNILGHIFEQSLSDLEEIEAQIDNIEFDKTKSKRKKDGVFYTPSYITKYIVDNTLGKLCKEKRDELKLQQINQPKNTRKLTKAEQLQKEHLQIYKEWLLNLKILDPACGSGAFLNAAMEFLIYEHTQLSKELALFGDLFVSYMLEKDILEHNLYGVDINENAIEIAKLSLWLRSAKKGRSLVGLNDKIVCANSLLEQPFPENSFDIVIGNPPYVRQELIKEQKPKLEQKYKTYTGTADLFVYFYELGINMLKENGIKGYICSNKFYRAKYGENLRDFILQSATILDIVDFNGVKVFEDASVDSTITILKKQKPLNKSEFKFTNPNLEDFTFISQNSLNKSSFTFLNPLEQTIKEKIEKLGVPLKKWDISINYGIRTGFNEAFIIDEQKKDELIKEDSKSAEIIKPILRGRDIKKYAVNFANLYVILAEVGSNKWLKEKYPSIYNHLKQYEIKLRNRGQVNTKNGHHWIELDNAPTPVYLKKFEKEKIFYNEIGNTIEFYYTKEEIYCNNKLYMITSNSKAPLDYFTGILNSKLLQFYFSMFFNFGGGKGKDTFQNIPIPKLSKEEQEPFINEVENIITSKEKIAKYKKHFDSLNAVDKIEINEEIEKLEASIQTSIDKIDQMVYKLYDLTADEIKIVEESLIFQKNRYT